MSLVNPSTVAGVAAELPQSNAAELAAKQAALQLEGEALAIQELLEHPVRGNYTYCGDLAHPPSNQSGPHEKLLNTSFGTTAQVTHRASGRRFRLPAGWNGRLVHPDRLTELAPL